MNTAPLPRISQILLILVLGTCILYFAKSLLIPLTFGAILAMLLIPLSRRMERRGINRGVASVLCILILILTFAVIITLLSWQVTNLMNDINEIKEKLKELVGQLQQFISSSIGIKPHKQAEIIEKAEPAGNSVNILAKTTGMLLKLAANTFLVLVYIFLFMYFRRHLMQFIIKVSPQEQQENVSHLTYEASQVSQQYLTGMALMIITLWILYSIGFSIVGVRYALFFAILCGVLEIVPFVGNLTGTTLTALMGLIQGGDIKLVLGILITYGLIQFVQSYILQPLIVGKEVNINPLFTIVSIVIGNAVWGIPGMILAIPLFGILKIVCDHFEPLKPYGFLLGEEKSSKGPGFMEKIKKLFK